MTNVTIEFLEKNQNWQEESTDYWFRLNGTEYNMCDRNGEVRLYDADNCPMDALGGDIDPRHDEIYSILYPEYQKRIYE